MNNQQLTFIGAGNMANSLVQGLIAKQYDNNLITVTDINEQQLEKISSSLGVNTSTNNIEAVESADIVVLAVKPNMIETIIKEIKAPLIANNALVISIAAGVRASDIQTWIGENQQAVIRCMPNTPALVGEGATALYANNHVSSEQKEIASLLLDAIGISVWMESESELDAVTALSGSGPAYFFLMVEAMTEAAVKLGLNASIAEQLARQTAYGAAKMVIETTETTTQLKDNVTSKGGTTEAALLSFESNNFRKIIFDAMQKAQLRSIELGEQLGESS